jgi:Pyruvate/2-oxoacid:ferredoxin oxidoreductase delta subunit
MKAKNCESCAFYCPDYAALRESHRELLEAIVGYRKTHFSVNDACQAANRLDAAITRAKKL